MSWASLTLAQALGERDNQPFRKRSKCYLGKSFNSPLPVVSWVATEEHDRSCRGYSLPLAAKEGAFKADFPIDLVSHSNLFFLGPRLRL